MATRAGGYVYFAHDASGTGCVKIGISIDPGARINAIQSEVGRLARMTRADLIATYRDALLAEPGIEAEDRLRDIDGSDWAPKADSSRKNSGNEALQYSCELEFMVRYRKDPRSYAPDVIMREVHRAS